MSTQAQTVDQTDTDIKAKKGCWKSGIDVEATLGAEFMRVACIAATTAAFVFGSSIMSLAVVAIPVYAFLTHDRARAKTELKTAANRSESYKQTGNRERGKKSNYWGNLATSLVPFV